MFKKLTFILGFSALVWACNSQQPTENNTPEEVVASAVAFYGDKITEDGAIAATEIPAKLQSADSAQMKVKAKIVQACKSKGCWMTIDLGNGKTMRVSFKDYGFFVPKDSDGKEAVFEGVVRKEKVSVESLKHFAEDAGKSKEEIEKITQAEDSFVFEASGVIIKG